MFFSTSPLPFCRQLINNKQSGDIEMAIGGMGRMIKAAGKFMGKKTNSKPRKAPPKKFDAMTEGRKVSQAKKMLKMKTKKEAAFAKIGRIMKEAGIGSSNPDKKSNIAKGSRLADPKRNRKAPTPTQLGGRSRKMGGGKIYASTDKKYGGGIFPRKGKM